MVAQGTVQRFRSVQSKYGNFNPDGQGADNESGDDADLNEDVAELTFPIYRGIRYVYAWIKTPFNAGTQQQAYGFWHMRCNFYGLADYPEHLADNSNHVCNLPVHSIYDSAKGIYMVRELYIEFPELWWPHSQVTGDSPRLLKKGIFPGNEYPQPRLCRCHIDLNTFTGSPTSGENWHCFWEVGCA